MLYFWFFFVFFSCFLDIYTMDFKEGIRKQHWQFKPCTMEQCFKQNYFRKDLEFCPNCHTIAKSDIDLFDDADNIVNFIRYSSGYYYLLHFKNAKFSKQDIYRFIERIKNICFMIADGIGSSAKLRTVDVFVRAFIDDKCTDFSFVIPMLPVV